MAVEIGTSDRILFKRCRRRWNWQSESRMGLQSKDPNNINLFIGTGVHFALEDWHGYRAYGSASEAFDAYVNAHHEHELPIDWSDDEYRAIYMMLQYYMHEWEPRYFGNRFETIWLEQKPMVEVRFSIPFHMMDGITKRHKVGKYRYTGTFDRPVRDEYGRLWIMDFKTARQFDTAKLETDPQVTAYTWAAEKVFGAKFEGVIWVQMLKDYPKEPRRLQNGTFSKAKDQRTTHALFRKALIDEYGQVPQEYIEVLNHFAAQETEYGNRFIRFDAVHKNDCSIKSEERKIVMEAREMADPKLSLYPNPTRDCSWDCPFRSPCIAMDDGADHEFILNENYEKAPSREDRDFWRPRLEWPADPIYIEC